MNIFRSAGLMKRVRKILGWSGGGIHKRIDENRELLELLQQEAPHLLKSYYWIEGWLKANDEFFNDLAATVPISEGRFLGHVKSTGTPFPRQWPNKSTNSNQATSA